MKKRRTPVWVWWALMLVSLPVSCLATWVLVPNPLFRGTLTIVNSSTERLYVTPVGSAYGRRHVLVDGYARFPYLPLFRRADLRLDPGRSLRIVCEIDEDLRFTEIVVRNRQGEYRQWTVDQPSSVLAPYPGNDARYVLPAFGDLLPVRPEALAVVRQARGIPWRTWGALLLVLAPLAFLVLLVKDLRARRSAQVTRLPPASRDQKESQARLKR